MAADDSLYEDFYKVVVVGDSAVGKSNLLCRYARDEFHATSKATIGVEFQTHRVDVGGGRRVQVQIWDTAGQERFRAVTSAFYRGALGALLVYDITRKHTFHNVSRWLEELRLHADILVLMMVGNKSDLEEAREVHVEEASAYAESEGLHFIETSALSTTNVNCAFETVVREIYEHVTNGRERRRLFSAPSTMQYQYKPIILNHNNSLILSHTDVGGQSLTQTVPPCCNV